MKNIVASDIFTCLIFVFDVIMLTEQAQTLAEEYWRVVKQGPLDFQLPHGTVATGINIKLLFPTTELFNFCNEANGAVNTCLDTNSNQVTRPENYEDSMGVYVVQKNENADEEYVRGYKCNVASGSRSFLLRVTNPAVLGPMYDLKAFILDGPKN